VIKFSIVKIKNKYFIEVSKEIADYLGSNISISKTNDEIIIKKRKSRLTTEEFTVLKKLNSFKFEKRIPSNVYKTLNKDEKKSLNSLIDKKIVSVYKGGKYEKTGVYSISQSIYPELIGKAKDTVKKKTPFGENEYIIIDNKGDAQKLSAQLKEQIKSGEIRGTRGFDEKFYISTGEFYNKHKDAVVKALKESANGLKLKEMSTITKLQESACLVVLRLLAEDGEIIEKGKNVFCLI